MLISIPAVTIQTATNVIDTTQIYDDANDYADGELVRYDSNDPVAGTDYSIYGVFDDGSGGDRLVYYSATNENAPFDSLNYSKASAQDEITYTVSGDCPFDTIAFGHIMAETISVTFIDETATALYSVIDYEIDNKIDPDGRQPRTPVTQILYCPYDMPIGSTVIISAKYQGQTVEIGSILLGLSLQAGYTHLSFTNTYEDYSPQEKDQWGNISYIEGVKTNVHSGTVDVPFTNYDYMNRTFLSIASKEVILNGYGAKSNAPPTEVEGSVYATQMIARIKTFSLRTNEKNQRLDEYATYTFLAEEIV